MPYEIDFLPVGEKTSSGDAICLRYSNANGGYTIHIVDGGFRDTCEDIKAHLRDYYDNPSYIDHVILSHADGDHAGGLIGVLEHFDVGALWMNRPWLYAAEIIHHFHGNYSVEGLIRYMRQKFSTLVELESIANRKQIPINDIFQNEVIGSFFVLAPSRARYVKLLPDFDKTHTRMSDLGTLASMLEATTATVSKLFESWNYETLSAKPPATSASNESSVVQAGFLDGKRVVLTADVGPAGLTEAVDFLSPNGPVRPDFMQVPHHGSRRNVSPNVLNRWLGPLCAEGTVNGTAFCSAARNDPDHPRAKVSNAFTRRGYPVHKPEWGYKRHYHGMPPRDGEAPSTPLPFRSEVED